MDRLLRADSGTPNENCRQLAFATDYTPLGSSSLRFIKRWNKRIVELARMTTKIQRAVVTFVMLLALTVQVGAQDLPVLGQGNLPCNSWTERRAGDAIDSATMIAWAPGYMTSGTSPALVQLLPTV